jgi:hypothetical protein
MIYRVVGVEIGQRFSVCAIEGLDPRSYEFAWLHSLSPASPGCASVIALP